MILFSAYIDQILCVTYYLWEEYVEGVLERFVVPRLQDPPTINQKGRPRRQRLIVELEGPSRDGGGSILRSSQASANRLCMPMCYPIATILVMILILI